MVLRSVLPDRVLGSRPQTSPPRVAMLPTSVVEGQVGCFVGSHVERRGRTGANVLVDRLEHLNQIGLLRLLRRSASDECEGDVA
jgi:hypothetical protein